VPVFNGTTLLPTQFSSWSHGQVRTDKRAREATAVTFQTQLAGKFLVKDPKNVFSPPSKTTRDVGLHVARQFGLIPAYERFLAETLGLIHANGADDFVRWSRSSRSCSGIDFLMGAFVIVLVSALRLPSLLDEHQVYAGK